MQRNLDRLVLRNVSFWAQFTDSLHAGLQSSQSGLTKEQLAGRGAFKGAVDCSQSPIFWMLLKRGTGSGERGTEVWERVVSGNLHKNPKWPVRIKDPVRSMIEKRRNNT